MVIEFSQGKIILTPFEVQVRLSTSGSTMYAMVEDIKFNDDALIINADAGAVRWSLRLDTLEQLNDIREELGIG